MATYTNILEIATDANGNVFNGTGYADGYKLSSYSGDVSQDTATDGYFVTGFIPYTIEDATNRVPIYVKGVTIDLTNIPQYLRASLTIPGDTQWFGVVTVTDMTNISQVTITKLGENYYRISPNSNFCYSNGWNSKELTHIRWGFQGSGEGVIMTIDEPIEDNTTPKYTDFIKENVAPQGIKHIGVYNQKGNKIGKVRLGRLAMPATGKKLFSFLMLSDVHVVYDTAEADLRRALTFAANNTDISFTCISGDLTDKGTEEQLTLYKTIVDECSPNKPVYACAGNHEYYNATSSSYLESYTGQSLCYTFTQGDHVFLMVGVSGGTAGSVFQDGQLQWLYNNLEANRDKHCWIVEHILPPEGSGDILALYPYSKLNGTEGDSFKSLLKHYKNAIFVHGHSHMQFDMQQYGMTANYDNAFGIHSIHVPSCAVPRNLADSGNTYETYYQGSEGYVVDVYENGIHLRGRDFIDETYLPIASYWLDTTIQEIEEKTYVDPTGIINTSGSTGEEEEAPFVYTNVLASATDASGNVLNGTGYKNSSRFSGYGGNMAQDSTTSGYFTTGFIPYTNEQLKNGTPFHIKGITLDLTSLPSYLRFTCCVPGSKDWAGAMTITDMTDKSQMTIYQLDDDYFVFVPNVNAYSANAWNTKALTHIRWCLPGNGENVKITVGELMGTGRNIPLNLKLGKLDSSTGQPVSDPDGIYTYSDEITLNPEKKYIFTLNNCLASVKVYYYDVSGAFLSCSDNVINIGESDRIASGSCRVPIIDGAASFRMRPSAKWYGSSYADSNALIFAGASLVECSEL